MTKMKPLQRIAVLLLCMFLALSCTAFAAEPDITIRITPPGGAAERRAAVEVLITDRSADGFRSAQAKVGSGSWQDLILAQLGNQYYGIVEVTGNSDVKVRVTGWNGTVYEKSRYIQSAALEDWSGAASAPTVQTLAAVMPVRADISQSSASAAEVPKAATESKVSTALTPKGQGTVVDNVTSENGKEFYTISTPEENTFYLIVDKEREDQNVYFLNAVTESDLKALAEKDAVMAEESAVPEPAPVCSCQVKCVPGSINAACPVCILSLQDCIGTVVADTDGQKQEPEKQDSSFFFVLIAALAAGGAGYYFKIYKPKQELNDAEDYDEMSDADEETVNEDDEPPVHGPDDEPEEPRWEDEV